MHRLPNGAGLDVGRLESEPHFHPVCAKGFRVDGQRRQPAGVETPVVFGHEGDARQIAKGGFVMIEVAPPGCDPLIQHFWLRPADAGRHVAHAMPNLLRVPGVRPLKIAPAPLPLLRTRGTGGSGAERFRDERLRRPEADDLRIKMEFTSNFS